MAWREAGHLDRWRGGLSSLDFATILAAGVLGLSGPPFLHAKQGDSSPSGDWDDPISYIINIQEL